MSPAKEAVAAKVEPEIKRKIEKVADEAGESVSQIGRRGLIHYVRTNPDGFGALGWTDETKRMMEDLEK